MTKSGIESLQEVCCLFDWYWHYYPTTSI